MSQFQFYFEKVKELRLRKALTIVILAVAIVNSGMLLDYYVKWPLSNLPLSHTASAQPYTVVYVDPENITGGLNDIFTIDIVVFNVTDLYGVDIRFSWDPSILEYVSHTAKIPVEDYPDGILHEPGMSIKDDVNATEGTYWLAYASMSPADPFDGSGIAFNMTFKIISLSGACTLDIVAAELSDITGSPLKGGWEIKDGLFTPAGAPIAKFSWWPEIGVVEKPVIFNASESYDPGGTIAKYYWDFGDGNATSTTNPVIAHTFNHTYMSKTYTVSLIVEDDSGTNSSKTTHSVAIVKSRNIAVQNVELTPTFRTLVNSTVTIDVTVENNGIGVEKENFTLAIYYNTSLTTWTLIEARNFTLKGAKIFTFEWNTTGVEPEKYYAINATATPIPYEDEADNTEVSDPIFVTAIEEHDMVITTLSIKATHGGKDFSLPIILGEDAKFSVTLMNNGTAEEENLNVTLYSNSALIKQWLLNDTLTQGGTATLEWVWSEITQIGNYNMTVHVDVENDTNPDDNTLRQYMQVINTPQLNITYTPSTVFVNENVTLNASSSIHNDPDGQITSYSWALYEPGATPGVDSPTAMLNGINVSYNFNEQGNWTIVLTVKDNYGITYDTKRTSTAPYRLEMQVYVQTAGFPLEYIVIPVIVIIVVVLVAILFHRRRARKPPS